jgi:hypothetical protein
MCNKLGSTIGVGVMGRSGDLGRSIHLVDIENLVGEPTSWRPNRIRATFDAYLQTATWRPGDTLVVAANPSFMKLFAFDLAGMAHRPLCAWGKDAADKLLLGAVPADVGARFGRIVVGSGDHAFAPLVASLRGCIETLVVTAAGLIAADLYVATDDVQRLAVESGPGGDTHAVSQDPQAGAARMSVAAR